MAKTRSRITISENMRDRISDIRRLPGMESLTDAQLIEQGLKTLYYDELKWKNWTDRVGDKMLERAAQ